MPQQRAIQGFRRHERATHDRTWARSTARLPDAVTRWDEVKRLEPALGSGDAALRALLGSVAAVVIARFLHQEDIKIALPTSSAGHVLVGLAITDRTTWIELADRVAAALTADEVIRPDGDDVAHVAVMPKAFDARSLKTAAHHVKAECYLALAVADSANKTLELRYETSLDPPLMAQLLDSIVEATRSLLEGPRAGRTVDDVSLVSEELRARLLDNCRGKRRRYPGRRTTRDLIDDVVASQPDAPAVIFGERRLTYQQLDGKANALAALLQDKGIGHGTAVGLLMGNSLELPIAILASLKLGASFIPLDERWPADRLAAIVRAAGPAAVVAPEEGRAFDDIEVVRIACRRLPATTDFSGLPLTLDDLAYGFPTSGSSGPPKCALNVHRGLLNRLLYMTRRYGADGGRITLQNSRHVFDSSLWQLLWPLTTGGCVVIPQAAQHLDLDETITLIGRHGVTMTDFVPSVFNMLVERLERAPDDVKRIASLENLLIGGEEINAGYCQRFSTLLPRVGLTNTYGPTEAAIGMVFHSVSASDGDRIPIGRPIDNTFAVVLDEQQRLMPPGAIGELFIGGDCLGVGYLHDAERTRKAWVANPFAELPGDRLYRTGDLVYQRDDGMLYFVGREDAQVKIGGVRIELSEIEHVLRKFTGVKAVAVCADDGVAGKRLVAHVATDCDLSASDLRAFLMQRLPRQCVPARFVLSDALPLTHNGKVDRGNLGSTTVRQDAPAARVATRETRLLAIWRRILDESGEITRDDDFFELGGDSLLALSLLGKVEEAFGVTLTLKGFYAGPTVAQLSQTIAAAGAARTTAQAAEGETDRRLASDLTLVDDLVARNGVSGSDPKCILVTGASGFIGAHVVSELLRRSSARVVCAMRDVEVSAAHVRLRAQMERFGLWMDGFAKYSEVVIGDLAAERLGLSPSTWKDLESDVDAIVHCGGVVDFLHGYERHRGVNVLSVAELLRLATRGRGKALHHLSSAEISPCRDGHAASRWCDGAPAAGYALSKWVAERLVLKGRSQGADVTLYRIGEAMPSTRTGIPNVSSLVYLLLKTCLVLGGYPEALVRLDYTPVDCVAQIVADAVLDGVHRGSSVGVFHPCGTTLDWVMNVFSSLGAQVRPTTADGFLRLLENADAEAGREVYGVLCVVRAAMEAQRDRGCKSLTNATLEGLFGAPADSLGSPAYGGSPDFWPGIDHGLLEPVFRQLSRDSASLHEYVGAMNGRSSSERVSIAAVSDERSFR
jgi:amino acid adenylation domain-containing protein/thioester reductase-like protein